MYVNTNFKNGYLKQSFIFLLTIFLLTACNQEKKSNENATTETINIATKGTTLNYPSTPNKAFYCSTFDFKNAKQQADTLIKYFDKNQSDADEKYFCAFPNSFQEMQALFGFDENKGAAPLYNDPYGKNMIKYFANLNSISKEIYFDKYINICVDGVWEADNIREAFGFADKLTNDAEAACSSLSKRSDKEIKSIFHFIFDGPHPKNEYNKKKYNKLLPILTKQSKKLGDLLIESYKLAIAEDDGHGH